MQILLIILYYTLNTYFVITIKYNKKRLRGYVLLSREVALRVPSALKSLTSVFEMGTGVTFLPSSPHISLRERCSLKTESTK